MGHLFWEEMTEIYIECTWLIISGYFMQNVT